MKKLSKQYRQLLKSIKDKKAEIKTIEAWENKTSLDYNELKRDKATLVKLQAEMIMVLQQINDESAKELKQREDEYSTSLQSA